MMKRTWIKLKRGVLEPKHVNAIGEAWPFFCYLLDGADWESGIVFEYQDKLAADDLGVHVQTIRRWRKRLEAGVYIRTERGQRSSKIVIYKWVNPRLYDERAVVNMPDLSDQKRSLKKKPLSDHETGILENEADQSDAQVTPENSQSDHAPLFPSLDHRSQITDHTKAALDGADDHSQADHSEPEQKPVTTTRDITDAYLRVLEIKADDVSWANGESAAAKFIAARWTVPQVEAALKVLAAQDFWKDKLITLAYLKKQMPVLVKSQNGSGPHSAQPVKVNAGLAAGMAAMEALKRQKS
jgi:hypothetical protein